MAAKRGRRRRSRAVVGAVVITLALLAWLIGGAATDAGTLSTVVNVDPATQVVTAGTPFSVNVIVENVTEMGADQATLHFDPQAMSVSQVTEGDFLKSAGTTVGAGLEDINNDNGYVTFFYALTTQGANVSGSGTLATINITTNLSAESTFALTLTDVLLSNGTGSNIPIDEVAHGTVTISAPPWAILDTGPGTYPSISGIHNGTIKPNQTITVYKLYTYPCPGTGGHTEYAAFYYSNGTKLAEAPSWNGYQGDWHNITFTEQFTLEEGKTYNYTIRTGSYPQIIHKPLFNATGGTITCTNFTDANGKTYTNWVPAIKLFL